MKTLALILAFTFSVMFPSPSFAEWKKVGSNVDGDTFYVDFDRIRKHDGYVYCGQLFDLLKPSPQGHADAQASVAWINLILNTAEKR